MKLRQVGQSPNMHQHSVMTRQWAVRCTYPLRRVSVVRAWSQHASLRVWAIIW